MEAFEAEVVDDYGPHRIQKESIALLAVEEQANERLHHNYDVGGDQTLEYVCSLVLN